MKVILTIISILLFSIATYAQEKCELNLSQSPTLQNLKLGMSPGEASNVLGIKVKAKPEGQSTFFKNYIKKKAKRNLTGVRVIYLRFYEGKLYQIEFFYETDYRWQTLDNLLDDFSSENNFSREFWQTKFGYSKANCQGFSIDADYILNPHIQITNGEVLKIVESKQEKLF
jgi:hypothetical protein